MQIEIFIATVPE